MYDLGRAYIKGEDIKEQLTYLSLDIGGAAVPFVTGLGMVARTAKVARFADKGIKIAEGTKDVARAGEKIDDVRKTAEAIGNGHAYDVHIVGKGEFKGIVNSKSELVDHVENVMRNPDRVEALPRGRTVFGQQSTKTIVIHDINHIDLGTVFETKNIQNRIDNLLGIIKK